MHDGALVFGAPRITATTIDAPRGVVRGERSLAPDDVWTGAWSSAPAVAPTARLVADPASVVVRAGELPLVVVDDRGAALAVDPCDPRDAAFVRWAYYPYLVHALSSVTEGRAPIPLRDFSPSPLPSRSRMPLAILALLSIVALAVVLLPRSHVDDASIAASLDRIAPAGWRRPGFERPLAGLLFYTSALLVLLGPYLYLSTVLIPSRVQPFPEVDGGLAPIDELLLLGWAILDFGMTSAIVRAVAGLRATKPERLVAHLRLLVRWQLVIGTLLGLVGAVIAIEILPSTRYAILARALLLRSLVAPLVALSVLPAICEALQRYDRQLVLELLDKRVLAVLLPIPLVLGFRSHALDEPYGALAGIVLGQALATIATGLVGATFVKQLGLPLRALVVGSSPNRDERRALYRFGAGIMAGKAVFFLAGMAELALVVGRLRGYPTWLGIKQILLGRLLYPLWLLWPFCESAVPSLSEAFAAGRRALARGYVVRYLQHGHLFVATLLALAIGAGAPLLRARLSTDWQLAADLLPLAGLTGLLLPLTWTGDALQRAAGRSGLNATLLLVEQALRLALLAWLLPALGLAGLFVASAAATIGKTVLVLVHAHRHVLSLSLPPRIVLLGPAAGAIVVGLVARGLVTIGLRGPVGLAEVAFALSALLAFPIALFITGLVGGLEPSALEELSAAQTLVPLRVVTGATSQILVGAARLGASLSSTARDHEVTTLAARDRDALIASTETR